MRMNRRNVLVGLGTIVVGGGGALATGAFSSVEATRSMSISTEDDSDAQLAIEVNNDYDTDQTEAEIDLENLNVNATTTFHGMIAITNQGTNEVGIGIEDDISDVTVSGGSEYTLADDTSDSEITFEINDSFGDANKFSGAASSNVDDGSLSSNTTLGTDETVVFDLIAYFDDSTDVDVFEGLDITITADVDDA